MSTPTRASDTRLDQLLEGLARFSGGGRGITRLVYDPAWCSAHQWLAGQARERGLAASPDWAGNLLLHDPAIPPSDPKRPAIVVGSHLDSVVGGGRYDGAYGTVSGLLLAAEFLKQ